MSLYERYPINIDELRKGQVITTDELTRIIGRRPEQDQHKWQWSLLALQGFIHDKTTLTVKIVPEGMRVLTDSEAAIYNHRRGAQALRAFMRRYERNGMVDETALSEEERKIHASNLLNQSRYASAILQTTRSIRIDPHDSGRPPLGLSN